MMLANFLLIIWTVYVVFDASGGLNEYHENKYQENEKRFVKEY